MYDEARNKININRKLNPLVELSERILDPVDGLVINLVDVL